MYIFELFFRKTVGYIGAAHHVGAIIIGQTATILFLDPAHKADAPLEFILCMLWGFFDVVAELWPHVAIIVYRTWPQKHRMLERVFRATAILEVLGTVVETITVFAIFCSVWKHWTVEFKILSPILHILFSCAQLFGASVFWDLARKQAKKARGKVGEREKEQETETEVKQGRVTMASSHELSMV